MTEETIELENITPKEIDSLIKSLEDLIKEQEEALLFNTEWPSEKMMDETRLLFIKKKEKKGWFSKRQQRHLENKIKRNNYRSPIKLSKEGRKILEETMERNKATIAFLKVLKEEKIKDPTGWKNKKIGQIYQRKN